MEKQEEKKRTNISYTIIHSIYLIDFNLYFCSIQLILERRGINKIQLLYLPDKFDNIKLTDN